MIRDVTYDVEVFIHEPDHPDLWHAWEKDFATSESAERMAKDLVKKNSWVLAARVVKRVRSDIVWSHGDDPHEGKTSFPSGRKAK